MAFDSPQATQNLLIDGKRLPAVSGRTFDTINPASEAVLAKVAEADAADVDLAVRSARAAFEGPWSRLPGEPGLRQAGGGDPAPGPRAFSSELASGSRSENA